MGKTNLGTACFNQSKVFYVWYIFIYKEIR